MSQASQLSFITSSTGQVVIAATTVSNSTVTGALIVAGGVGVAGSMFVGGTVTATSFVGALTGTASTATSAAIAYSLGNTSTTIVGRATTATNIIGGTVGQVLYQSAPGVTGFVGPGTAGQVLVSGGTATPLYQNTLTLAGTTAATSTQTGALQVAGGVGIGGTLYVGSLRADATTSGTTFATYYNPVTKELTTATITASGGGATLSATSVNSTFYVPLASSQAGSYTIAYNTSTFYFNPSLGTAYATIFQSLSDESQKANISIISNGLEIVENLRGVTFDWINGTGSSAGLVAQDVERWLPQLISIDPNGVKNLNYSGVIGALVEAVKTLSDRVKALESR